MKKFILGVFIFADMIIVGASGFVLVTYIQRQMPMRSAVSTGPSGLLSTTPGVKPSNSTAKNLGGSLLAPAAGDTAQRKILFSYRSPRARQVSIRADFTGWKAEPMKKAANGTWTYQAQLTPGEYAYCYTADDKTFKDPANKRTKQIGRTVVSAIVVEALPPKTPK